MKSCPKCSESYPATPEFFSKDRTKKDGFHTICKVCESAHKKAYREAHKELIYQQKKAHRERCKEHIAAYKQQYQQGPTHKAYQKRYHQDHASELTIQKSQYYQANREKLTLRQRQYLQTPQGRIVDKAHRHKRKAQKRASNGSYTSQQLQEQMARQKGKCYYCHKKVGSVWHADHVIPLARGGSNTIDNIVIACPTCNMRKKDKLLHEWPEGGRLL